MSLASFSFLFKAAFNELNSSSRSGNREKAREASAAFYGKSPRAFKYFEELLASRDLDAVIISTPEHSHSPILKLAAEAGKDVYVEKPMGNVLADIKAAREAVLKHRIIVQVGTQHRSELHPKAGSQAQPALGTGNVGCEPRCSQRLPRDRAIGVPVWRGRRQPL